jgi:hypothetical protein
LSLAKQPDSRTAASAVAPIAAVLMLAPAA